MSVASKMSKTTKFDFDEILMDKVKPIENQRRCHASLV